MSGSVVLVVNPRSAAGRTGRHLDVLEADARKVFGDVRIVTTNTTGDGTRIAREAAEDGAPIVLAVGGDGTANEVVGGLVAARRQDVQFGLVPAGTGSDLARALAVPKTWPEALAAIRASTPVRVDVMSGRFAQPDGSEWSRIGINVIGLGMAGEVVRRVNEGSKALGGKVTFLAATLRTLASWRAPEASITWRDEHGATGQWSGKLMNAFVANGRYCGGGMLVGPSASMTDGLLDVVIIPDLPLPRLLLSTGRLYDGSIAKVPGVISLRVRQLSATTRGRFVPSDIDGEQPGGLPLSIEVVPRALLVRAPALSAPPR